MSQLPAGYNRYQIKGLAAKAIQNFKARGATSENMDAIRDLADSVKFSLGETANLPRVCNYDDAEQMRGEIRLPFNLMAIELQNEFGESLIALFNRTTATTVEVTGFAKSDLQGNLEGGWGISATIEISHDGDELHTFRVVDSEHIEATADECSSSASKVEESCINGASQFYKYLRTLNALIACTNVGIEAVVAPDTRKLGKRKRDLLRFEYRILTLKINPSHSQSLPTDRTHRPPRLHLRRGHIRNLPTGKTTWITQCIVGDASAGIVRKDYKLQARQ